MPSGIEERLFVDLQHINVKLLLSNAEDLDLDGVIPVFHSWIQDQVTDELLLDVADYRHVYGGPGIEFWSGKGKETYEGANASPDETGPTTTRFGLGGRMGGFLKCSDKVSLVGHIGHTWGYASVSKDGGKTTWWPSSFEGSGGVAFNFGSSK